MNRLLSLIAASLLSLSAAAAHSAPTPSRSVMVTSAGWTRAMPPGAMVSAGYLTLRNEGPAADRLVSARSAAAKSVELHQTTMIDGEMQMRQVEALEVVAGSTVNFVPGGMHLMLLGLVRPLKVGEVITVTLQFERAGPVAAQLRVRPIGSTGP